MSVISNVSVPLFSMFLFIIAGCAVTDIDRSADFNRYRSFGWGKANVDVDNPLYESGLIDKKIKSTIAKEFKKRGIYPDQDQPDFLVSYQTYTEEKERTTGGGYYGYPFHPFRYYPFVYGWGWGFPYGYGWSGAPRTYSVTEGTLIVDIKDARTKELIWRGAVSGNVDNVSGLQKQIEKGVRAIMKKYPVTTQERFALPANEGDIS